MIRLEFRDFKFDIIAVHILECDDLKHAEIYAGWIKYNYKEVEHCLFQTDFYYGCIIL